MTATLKEKYGKEIVDMLKKELSQSNVHALPKLIKVNINVGIGSQVTRGEKDFSAIEKSVSEITGQKPAVRRARIAVSNFKLRKGMPVGLAVTLRGQRMYDFVERLVNVALPRVRDFRGISVKGFDGKGNFSLGLKDANIFPEIDQDSFKSHGIQINVCTSAETDYEAYLLLKAMGFPFKDEVSAPKAQDS